APIPSTRANVPKLRNGMLYRCGRLLSTSHSPAFSAKRASATALALKSLENISSPAIIANAAGNRKTRPSFTTREKCEALERQVEEQATVSTTRNAPKDSKSTIENKQNPQYFTQHPARVLLNDLRQLDTNAVPSDTSTARPHLESLWNRWTSLHSDIWSTYALPIVTLFVRLAGKMLNPILLGTISHFVKTYSDIVPPAERILHPSQPDAPSLNSTAIKEGIVVQWGVAESSLGTTDWGGIVQALRSAGLAPPGRIEDDTISTFASYVVEEWAERRPETALELYASAQREGIQLPNRSLFALCHAAIDIGQYDRALEILSQGTMALKHRRQVVGRMVEAVSRDGIVSLNAGMAAVMGESMSAVASKEMVRPTNRRHWEWCITVLARSRHERLAYQIYQALHPQEWSTSFLLELCTILCNGRSFKLAGNVASSLDNAHPLRKDLHHMVFRHSSRDGLNKLARQSWDALQTVKDFVPTQYDHLLFRQALRAERVGKKVSPLPVTSRLDMQDPRTVILGHRMLSDTGRNKLANQKVAALLEDGGTTQQHWTSSTVLCTVNNALTSELRAKSVRTTNNILDIVSRLFQRQASAASSSSAHLITYGVPPDPISLNIVLGAWLGLKEVYAEDINELVDKLVALGYPASGQTSLFNTRPSPHMKPIAGFVEEVLSIDERATRLSVQKHVLPLYKMLMKQLYMRGDIMSARQVMYIYKGLRNSSELERENVTRERHLKSLKGREKEKKITKPS
ncbi:hypothetical protein FRB90_002651, partial [Tulasnella sp. 427]